ncbi:MAG: SDR family oxidoreductase [Candidatus Marinimicrobia bacterium]|nr:SDR family oxidoreductase [Candidatus Neomarinimicrobiota bacterium]MCF7828015.1 SDR family oxidoreductase [Candidatus Neomarinimicrobiota bacterium]MCF7879230.1 SDR family oxidoreductase [Candidatus Neomarinimicrobiota bacterium]
MATADNKWALVLGASSGFGKATALELSRYGYHICGIHFDRKSMQTQVDAIKEEIEGNGTTALFFNINAADEEKRGGVLDDLSQKFAEANGTSQVMILMHSLAFGTLRPFITDEPSDAIAKKHMEMTLNVMAHTLVYWTQDLVHRDLVGEGTHIFGMTSSGGHEVWKTYGAVSAAKAALESHIRQLAFELSPQNIAVNAIRAGVTDTPALRKIPGSDEMIDIATQKNPGGRLTTPEDVASAIALLADANNTWMTGNVIGVDGGEDVAG